MVTTVAVTAARVATIRVSVMNIVSKVPVSMVHLVVKLGIMLSVVEIAWTNVNLFLSNVVI